MSTNPWDRTRRENVEAADELADLVFALTDMELDLSDQATQETHDAKRFDQLTNEAAGLKAALQLVKEREQVLRQIARAQDAR
jgi:hypothetical protein